MSERRTIDAVFILRRMQEEYHAEEKKLYMCFVDIEKSFDRISRKLFEWALRKKEIPEVLVRSVISQYEGAKKKSVIFQCYSSEKLIALNTLHEVVPT